MISGKAFSFRLRLKLSLIVIAVIAIVMVPFGWFTVHDLERAAEEEAVSQLKLNNLMLRNMIAANQDGLQSALQRLGTVFRQHYQGNFSLDEANPVEVGGIKAPVLKVNGRAIELDHRVVNQFSRETGGSIATVFVRKGDDFLRITTSLTKEDGMPAIGTFLGKSHPAYEKALAGESYRGQAWLFGRPYMTEYIPVRDVSRRVVALLLVGMDLTESIESLLAKIRGVAIGKSGYVFVVNVAAGDRYGHFLVHPAKEGKNALTDRSNEREGPIREILDRREGVLHYHWQNQELGDTMPRRKIAAFFEYRELGWIVGTSGYLDDFLALSRQARDRMILALLAVSLFAIGALNISVSRWVITPVLRLQNKLRSAERTLRTVLDNMQEAVFLHRVDGSIADVNEKMLQLYGVDKETALTLSNTRDYSAPDNQVHDLQAIWQRVLAGHVESFEWRARRPLDGKIFLVEVNLRKCVVEGEDMVLALVLDITKRKETEARQRLALRMFETTQEAIMVTDARARIVAVNPAFCLITGYTEAEVLGKDPSMLNSGRHDKAFYEAMWQALQSIGAWSGEIWNRRKNGEVFPEWQSLSSVRDEAGKVTHYVAVFTDLSEIRRAEERAEQLSWRDRLTGLANRALFLRQLEQALANAHREGSFATVLLLDLDRFKDINEACGLAIGDALLREVAQRLGQTLHADDLLARLDSDEFAVLLPRLVKTREAAGREALAVVETLRAALRRSIEMNGEIFHLDASIGIAVLPETPQETASDVLRQADMAMHQAKDEGGGRAVFFEAAMGEQVKERYRVEWELRQAVAEDQLRLYLQPQVDAAGRQVGAEALVRWQHPERGLVPPGLFIPLAETSDLIVAVDRWMLTQVCRLLASLDAQGLALRVSVNVSPRHFSHADFVDEIKRQLADSGADPAYLVLEVTEGLVIGDFNDVVAKMTTLTALGIHFSMDDFGTGYSSLAYLKRLPIQELKIDKSFIDGVATDSNDAVLVETILAVAQHLRLQVVAEGVETEEQAKFLNARGEVIHQGYLYGRPEPVEAWLARLHADASTTPLDMSSS